MADGQPGIPQHRKQARNRIGMRQLVGRLTQHQHVDIRVREQLAAAITAHRKQAQPAVRRQALHPGSAQQLVHRARAQRDQLFRIFRLAETTVQPCLGLDQHFACTRRPGPVTGGVDLGVGPRGNEVAAHSGGTSPAARVNTSTPVSVTATICSHCADSLRSLVTTVQPSGSTLV